VSKFAIVAPINIVQELDMHNILGPTHLLLAHDVVKHPMEYNRLFSAKRIHRERLVILDNSVIELGAAVDLPMIREACEIVEPTCVCLPDVLLDTKATIDSCSEALETWSKELRKTQHFKEAPRYMLCPQGKTFEDFIRCAEAFADDPRITVWGVPRNLVGWIGSRQAAIEILHVINPRRKIHLLGFSDNMADDMMCARDFRVMSIDSAVPLRLDFDLQLSSKIPPRGNWWDHAFYTDVIARNLVRVRMWVNDRDVLQIEAHIFETIDP
jgi:hypothetical protein